MKVSFVDTGVGISPEGIENLFVDFGKLGENSERNKCGTGLGLSICKKIIEQMGGSVVVTSELGVGTKFIVNIKMQCIVKKAVIIMEPEAENQIEQAGSYKFINSLNGKIMYTLKSRHSQGILPVEQSNSSNSKSIQKKRSDSVDHDGIDLINGPHN